MQSVFVQVAALTKAESNAHCAVATGVRVRGFEEKIQNINGPRTNYGRLSPAVHFHLQPRMLPAKRDRQALQETRMIRHAIGRLGYLAARHVE